MDGVELLRARNRFEETLPSGLAVTLRLPRIRDCIIAGGVPLPVVTKLVEQSAKAEDNGEVSSIEDAAYMARYQDELVRRAVVAIEGEPVDLSLEDVAEFRQEDYNHIVKIAAREVELPLADVPA
jgi:hypothetical protein